MTAKQQLLEYVSRLTEEEAEDKLPWLAPILEPRPANRRLNPAERAAVDRGLADIEAGQFVTLEELEAEMEEWDD
ncbi:MAG: hypothetical protein IT300_15945 [Dehalococcoidia bacterium]|nr:hypothetical protein [Dehalococcoidia bacterium]